MIKVESPLVIVAGNGWFPVECAREGQRKGLKVFVLAHEGETEKGIEDFCDRIVWVKVGQLGKILKNIASYSCHNAVLSGGLSRIKMFSNAWPDAAALKLIARVKSLRDDRILRGIAEEIEKLGVRVIGADTLLPHCVSKFGYLSKRQLSEAERSDALVGWEAAKLLGQADVGQTAVVCDGLVVALECVEGTDRTILRAREFAGQKPLTVVKVSKPSQDLRLDLPSIGPETIERMKEAKVSSLVLEEGKSMILDPQKTLELANQHEIAIFVARTIEDLSLG